MGQDITFAQKKGNILDGTCNFVDEAYNRIIEFAERKHFADCRDLKEKRCGMDMSYLAAPF